MASGPRAEPGRLLADRGVAGDLLDPRLAGRRDVSPGGSTRASSCGWTARPDPTSSRPGGAASRAAARSSGTSSASTDSRMVQVPRRFPSSTAASPAGSISPAAVSRATRSRFGRDQALCGLRGQTQILARSSSSLPAGGIDPADAEQLLGRRPRSPSPACRSHGDIRRARRPSRSRGARSSHARQAARSGGCTQGRPSGATPSSVIDRRPAPR